MCPYSLGQASLVKAWGDSNNLRNFSKETRNLSRRLTSLSAALSTVVAGAGVGSLIKQQFSANDASAKMADTLGISTQRMAGLQHQAKLAGIERDSEQLNAILC